MAESCPGIEQQEEEVGRGRILYVIVADRLQLMMQSQNGAFSNALAIKGQRRKSAIMRGQQSRRSAETKSKDGRQMRCWREKNKESCVIRDLVSQLLLGKDREPRMGNVVNDPLSHSWSER